MSRYGKITAAVAAVLVAAGLAIGLTVGLSGPSSSPTATASAAPTRFPAAQATRLQQGMTAPTIPAQASVVALEVREQFQRKDKPLLPTGSHLKINAVTFHELSPRIATVEAAVTGPAPGRWQLVLVRESGNWLLIGTRQLT